MYSNQKLALDLLIFVFITFVISTTILSISTPNWNINASHNRTGLFQQCLSTCCCQTKELNRTITILSLFSIILLLIGTSSSFLLMITTVVHRNRYYMFVPLTLLGAGVTMTLTFVRVYELIHANSYSAYIFLIDIVLNYVLGGITILHGSLFYF
ncbi:unnamed protein product [Rotaria socialis]|uniref:Uncharacterized protein n=1 Tax=Rotaria socialis TaxID=392032 RepID=A0A818DTK6_9BILA|nr:unnamed protein product [Rotaria socialis]CAF3379420.1 unnamed protein product [Rotaria socialis]CAF3451802.1 unnamed protein product [Rotaria socialis]CAF3489687.1 unnamed protein product [Rotaria socialis]CAF4161337.1 unnamed protein product [Rotaria socialis]